MSDILHGGNSNGKGERANKAKKSAIPFGRFPASLVDSGILAHLTGSEAKLYIAIARYVNADWQSWPSVRVLAQRAGVNERSIRRMTARMEALGAIRKRQGGGRGRANVYELVAINPDTHAPLSGDERRTNGAGKPGHGAPERGTRRARNPDLGNRPTDQGTNQKNKPSTATAKADAAGVVGSLRCAEELTTDQRELVERLEDLRWGNAERRVRQVLENPALVAAALAQTGELENLTNPAGYLQRIFDGSIELRDEHCGGSSVDRMLRQGEAKASAKLRELRGADLGPRRILTPDELDAIMASDGGMADWQPAAHDAADDSTPTPAGSGARKVRRALKTDKAETLVGRMRGEGEPHAVRYRLDADGPWVDMRNARVSRSTKGLHINHRVIVPSEIPLLQWEIETDEEWRARERAELALDVALKTRTKLTPQERATLVLYANPERLYLLCRESMTFRGKTVPKSRIRHCESRGLLVNHEPWVPLDALGEVRLDEHEDQPAEGAR